MEINPYQPSVAVSGEPSKKGRLWNVVGWIIMAMVGFLGFRLTSLVLAEGHDFSPEEWRSVNVLYWLEAWLFMMGLALRVRTKTITALAVVFGCCFVGATYLFYRYG